MACSNTSRGSLGCFQSITMQMRIVCCNLSKKISLSLPNGRQRNYKCGIIKRKMPIASPLKPCAEGLFSTRKTDTGQDQLYMTAQHPIPLPAPLPPPAHSRLQNSSTRDILQTWDSTGQAGSGYPLELAVTQVVPPDLARRGLCRGVA